MLKLLRNLTIPWGIFISSEKQALHFWFGDQSSHLMTSRRTDQHLQPSPFTVFYKRPFSELKLSHKPSFSNEKRSHFPLTEVQDTPRRGSQLQEHNTPRAAVMMLFPRVAVRFRIAACEKAQINFLLVLGLQPSCSPSKLQVRIQD